MIKKIKWQSKHIEFDTISNGFKMPEKKGFDEDDEENVNEILNSMPTITQTPFGLFKLDDSMHPFKDFKFWMAHLNFKLTKKMFNILNNKIVGIEVLIPISPLRFLIAVGEQFEFSEVQAEINDALCGPSIESKIAIIENEEIENKVKELINQISSSDNKWAIYVLPNGSIDYSLEQQEDFDEKIALYKESTKLTGGVLIQGS